LATAGDTRLSRQQFPSVIVDECKQAVEPECLVALVKGATHVVLIGDHQQLGPTIMCREAEQNGYGYSMFERLRDVLPLELMTMLRVSE
jgi:regulator of nonsense transcripts 1